eukprot:scaffold102602_cov37-Phaeocystis_antarctica.AAC.1
MVATASAIDVCRPLASGTLVARSCSETAAASCAASTFCSRAATSAFWPSRASRPPHAASSAA